MVVYGYGVLRTAHDNIAGERVGSISISSSIVGPAIVAIQRWGHVSVESVVVVRSSQPGALLVGTALNDVTGNGVTEPVGERYAKKKKEHA